MARIEWETRLEELDTGPDNSIELEQQVLQITLDAVADYAPQSPDSYTRWLLSLVRRVLGVHPACSRLIGLFNRLLWSVENLGVQEMTLRFLDGLQQWSGDTYLASETLAKHAAEAMSNAETIVAYSYTPRLRHSLVQIAETNRNARFICSEGRPDLEGHLAVLDLAASGAPVTITTDMALCELVAGASALIIGAQALSTDGMIVRTGTTSLIRTAHDLEIPVLVVGTLLDAVPHRFPLERLIRRGDTTSIMTETDTIKVYSSLESVTSLDYVNAIITEEGPTRPAQLMEHLTNIELYPGLIGRTH